MLIRPAMTSRVPAAGSQLSLNCVSTGSPALLTMSQPGPVEEVGPGLLGQEVHDGGDVGDREDRDDHEVRRVGAQHLGPVVGRAAAASPPACATGHGGRAAAAGRRRRCAATACRVVRSAPASCLGALGGQHLGRLPDPHQQHQRAGGQQRGDDVGELHRDVVGGHELGDREDAAGEQGRQPGLAYAAPAVDDQHQDRAAPRAPGSASADRPSTRACPARWRPRAGGRC